MSRIDELIQQLCPDGVEYKPLGELCFLSRGKVISKDYLRDHPGVYPVFSSQTVDDGVFGKIDSFEYDGEYLTWTTDGANAGSIFFRSGRFSITNVCGLLELKSPEIRLRFLFYWLQVVAPSYVNAGMGNPKLMSNVMETISCPIPPLPVQEEIVRILDKFTALEAELEAELEARRKQYEFYRDQLLTFGDEVEWKPLGEIFDTRNGYTPSTTNKQFWEQGKVPWFRMEDIRIHGRILHDSLQHISFEAVKGGRLFPANSLLVATSATIGEHALITVPHLSNQRFTSLSLKMEYIEKLNIRFLYYYCFHLDQWCKNNIIKSSFASVDMGGFKKFMFPLPTLAEQERIVAILDKFDALVNDISSGLPAELEMRRKQYEYYRDRLLTFPKKKA